MQLNEKLNRHINLKFPKSLIENDELADCHSDLAELDGYIVGIVQSGDRVSQETKEKISSLIRRVLSISNLTSSDSIIKNDILEYLNSLKSIS